MLAACGTNRDGLSARRANGPSVWQSKHKPPTDGTEQKAKHEPGEHLIPKALPNERPHYTERTQPRRKVR
jgi:hypothetical protein